MSAQWSAVSGQPSGSRAVELVTACLLGAVCGVLPGCASPTPMMVINVPVVDLRAQPHTAAVPDTHDPLQETQLLYGERVQVIKVEKGWASIEAVEQPEFTHTGRWQGYPGWVPASALLPWEPLLAPTIVVTDLWARAFQDAFTMIPSPWRFPIGTRLRAIEMGGQLWKVELGDGSTVWMPRQYARSLMELDVLPPLEKRWAIVRHAERFIGMPYFWGGRSPTRDDPGPPRRWRGPPITGAGEGPAVTGVDCSGLVNLAFRAVGVEIPRDAHEQFLRATPVNALQPADLIFLSERSNPQRIIHVMLYAGEGEIIEGPGTGQAVRRIAIATRLGQSLDRLTPGAVVEDQTVFLGTYFP